MINSAHIFKELNAILPAIKKQYTEKDVFFIGLRLSDRSTTKVEVLVDEIVPVLFKIIDTNHARCSEDVHPIWQQDEYKGKNLLSIFICDSTSQNVYDSSYYAQTPAKYNLKRDKDIRILQFTQLDEEEKAQVIEMIATQIGEMQEDCANGVSPEDVGPETNWGEMPWD